MIQIRGVRKAFGTQLVLDGVDLDIPQGAVVSIIGPSGSGKSTLLRVIDYLESADAGTIDFGQGSISLASAQPKDIFSIRSRIGFVFQNYNLFLNKTALDNVSLGLMHAKGKSRKEAERIALDELKRVGMQDFADRYPSKLSGGQQQRIAIARAIALEPELLVLDEPTSALIRKWWTRCLPRSNPWPTPERPCLWSPMRCVSPATPPTMSSFSNTATSWSRAVRNESSIIRPNPVPHGFCHRYMIPV